MTSGGARAARRTRTIVTTLARPLEVTPASAQAGRTSRIVRLLGTFVAGLVLGAAGAGTWAMVRFSA